MRSAYRSRTLKLRASANPAGTSTAVSSSSIASWGFSAAFHLAILVVGWSAAKHAAPESMGHEARFDADLEIAGAALLRAAETEAPPPPIRSANSPEPLDLLRHADLDAESPPQVAPPDLCLHPPDSEPSPAWPLPFSGPVAGGLRLPSTRPIARPPAPIHAPPPAPVLAAPNRPSPSLPATAPLVETLVLPEPLPGNPAPTYPRGALAKGHTGSVHLLVLVDQGGAPVQITLTVSSGFDSLDRAAKEAVARWRFQPGTRNGTRTSMTRSVQVDFRR